MQAIQLTARGGPEVLACGEMATPRPGPGELLVRVHNAAVTPTELSWMPTWSTPTGEPRAFPIIPGHEFSGVVQAIGEGATGFAIGDAIYGMNDWFQNGAQAEYCLAKAGDVARKPTTIEHAAAAMVPISALTAWQGLIERAKLNSGERVLVHGAAGSVGLFAVQLARWRGAEVLGTASARNLEFVRELGANHVIDHRAQRFEDVVDKVDVVFDTVGGDTLARSWSILRSGGRLVTIATAEEQTDDPRVKDAFFIVERNGAQLVTIADLIDAGDIRPIVDTLFPLAAMREAYEHKPIRGKVVLAVTT